MKKLMCLLICFSFFMAMGPVVSSADDKVDFGGVYKAWAPSEKDRDYDSNMDDDRNYF